MSVQQIDSGLLATEQPVAHSVVLRVTVRIAAWCFVAVAAIGLLGRLLFEYFQQLWGAEHYRFVPMLLVAAAWLAWRRVGSLPTPMFAPVTRSMRVALWAAALVTTAVALFAQSPFVAAVAILVYLLAGLYEYGGGLAVRHFLSVWAVLLLALRLPFNWDQRLIVGLQRAATYWASGTLDLLGIRHLADGVVIRLPVRDFFIDEACSGVHSLFATAAFVAVFAAATRKGFLRFAALMIAALFWVFVANAVRVLAVVVLSTRYNLPVVDGLGHELLGIAVFAAVIGLVLSTDRLLLFIFPPKEVFSGDIDWLPSADLNLKPRNARVPFILASCLMAISVSMYLLPSQAAANAPTPYSVQEGLIPVPEDSLPVNWNGWTKVEFQVRTRDRNDPAGEISRIWYYRKGRLIAAVSIDGPFDTWHDTEVCYDALGYTAQAREDVAISDGGLSTGGYTELTIANEAGRHGHVFFMAYGQDGEALSPPPSRNASFARLLSIWNDRLSGTTAIDSPDGPIYQVQVFSESGIEITSAERDELRGLFHQMRREIAKLTVKLRQSAGPDLAPQSAGELDP